MTTLDKIKSNRRNAMRSTGPKTKMGKAISSKNALRHGLLSRAALLPDEDPEAFADLQRGIEADLDPALVRPNAGSSIGSRWLFGVSRAPSGWKRACSRTEWPTNGLTWRQAMREVVRATSSLKCSEAEPGDHGSRTS